MNDQMNFNQENALDNSDRDHRFSYQCSSAAGRQSRDPPVHPSKVPSSPERQPYAYVYVGKSNGEQSTIVSGLTMDKNIHQFGEDDIPSKLYITPEDEFLYDENEDEALERLVQKYKALKSRSDVIEEQSRSSHNSRNSRKSRDPEPVMDGVPSRCGTSESAQFDYRNIHQMDGYANPEVMVQQQQQQEQRQYQYSHDYDIEAPQQGTAPPHMLGGFSQQGNDQEIRSNTVIRADDRGSPFFIGDVNSASGSVRQPQQSAASHHTRTFSSERLGDEPSSNRQFLPSRSLQELPEQMPLSALDLEKDYGYELVPVAKKSRGSGWCMPALCFVFGVIATFAIFVLMNMMDASVAGYEVSFVRGGNMLQESRESALDENIKVRPSNETVAPTGPLHTTTSPTGIHGPKSPTSTPVGPTQSTMSVPVLAPTTAPVVTTSSFPSQSLYPGVQTTTPAPVTTSSPVGSSTSQPQTQPVSAPVSITASPVTTQAPATSAPVTTTSPTMTSSTTTSTPVGSSTPQPQTQATSAPVSTTASPVTTQPPATSAPETTTSPTETISTTTSTPVGSSTSQPQAQTTSAPVLTTASPVTTQTPATSAPETTTSPTVTSPATTSSPVGSSISQTTESPQTQPTTTSAPFTTTQTATSATTTTTAVTNPTTTTSASTSDPITATESTQTQTTASFPFTTTTQATTNPTTTTSQATSSTQATTSTTTATTTAQPSSTSTTVATNPATSTQASTSSTQASSTSATNPTTTSQATTTTSSTQASTTTAARNPVTQAPTDPPTKAPTSPPTDSPTPAPVWDLVAGPFTATGVKSGYGRSVAIAGNFVAAGQPLGSSVGQVHLYKEQTLSWTKVSAQLDLNALQFGSSVDLAIVSGQGSILVGAKNTEVIVEGGEKEKFGSAAYYEFNDQGSWTQLGSVQQPDPTIFNAGGDFGANVAMAKTIRRFAVAAPESSQSGSLVKSGKIYTYQWNGNNWFQMTATPIHGVTSQTYLGSAINMSRDGSRLLAGAAKSRSGSGSVFYYKWDDATVGWKSIFSFPGESGYSLGTSVSIVSDDGGTIAFGAPNSGSNGEGQIQVFQENGGLFSRLPDIVGSADEKIGKTLAGAKGRVAYGTESGEFHVVEFNGSSWAEVAGGVSTGSAVVSIDISEDGNTVVVGLADEKTNIYRLQ